ncbi:hypothetical protein DFH09DRAFT_1315724 [Mycena vulgaris]|nr:hypothetical protein DFH09DRAFT_1315724 [Mycena vulgaris]
MANPFNFDYNVTKSAFALCFKNDQNQRAFRLEIPGIGMELTDDSEGFIYYDKESDFEKSSNKNHRYELTVDTIGGRTYALVMFRHSPNKKPYTKFYAPDNHRVSRAAEMEDHSGTCNWIGRKATDSRRTAPPRTGTAPSKSQLMALSVPS